MEGSWLEEQRNTSADAAAEVNGLHAIGQAQEAPQPHRGPQAQAGCSTAFWQPQLQVAPGQLVQRQGLGFVSFMMSFLGVDRRRDVFDD